VWPGLSPYPSSFDLLVLFYLFRHNSYANFLCSVTSCFHAGYRNLGGFWGLTQDFVESVVRLKFTTFVHPFGRAANSNKMQVLRLRCAPLRMTILGWVVKRTGNGNDKCRFLRPTLRGGTAKDGAPERLGLCGHKEKSRSSASRRMTIRKFTLRMNSHSVMLSPRKRSGFPAAVWVGWFL
jgi:hypothetical protein